MVLRNQQADAQNFVKLFHEKSPLLRGTSSYKRGLHPIISPGSRKRGVQITLNPSQTALTSMLETVKIGVWEPRKGLMPRGFHRMASKPVCSLAIAHRFCCLHSRTSQGRGSVRGEPLTGSPTRVQSPARRRPLLRSKSAAPKRKHHPDGWCFLFVIFHYFCCQ